MKIHSSFHPMRVFRSFIRSERGSMLPLLAFSMIAIVGFSGVAIDVGRTQMVQSKLQFALDSAALAAGSTVSTEDLISEATKYLNANFNGYQGATLTANNLGNVVTVSSINASSTSISMTAQAKMPTTFMQALGISSVNIKASSTIARQISGLEVTVMIDVSYGDNLSEFTNGLKGFITDLFQSAPSVSGNLYVSIVPFNQTVNVGAQNASWTTGHVGATNSAAFAAAGWGPGGSWGGCVDARSGSAATSDTPAPSSPYAQYYYPSDTAATIRTKAQNTITTTVANAEYATYSNWNNLNSQQDTLSPMSSTWQYYMGLNIWYNGSLPSAHQYISPLNTANQGPNFMCPSPIVPLTNSAATAMGAINSIQWVQGDWLPDLGLQWSWNTLSPRWQGIWGSLTDVQGNPLPHAYNTKGWNKVLVWVEGTGTSVYPWTSYNFIDNSIRGAYGYLSDGLLGTTDMATADTKIVNNMTSICASMQSDNVQIYTLGYSPDGTVGGLPSFMTGCASGSNYIYWFSNNDWSAFDTALNSISSSITKLWLGQ